MQYEEPAHARTPCKTCQKFEGDSHLNYPPWVLTLFALQNLTSGGDHELPRRAAPAVHKPVEIRSCSGIDNGPAAPARREAAPSKSAARLGVKAEQVP